MFALFLYVCALYKLVIDHRRPSIQTIPAHQVELIKHHHHGQEDLVSAGLVAMQVVVISTVAKMKTRTALYPSSQVSKHLEKVEPEAYVVVYNSIAGMMMNRRNMSRGKAA